MRNFLAFAVVAGLFLLSVGYYVVLNYFLSYKDLTPWIRIPLLILFWCPYLFLIPLLLGESLYRWARKTWRKRFKK